MPDDVINYAYVAYSSSVGVGAALKFLYIVVFRWNWIVTQNQEKLYDFSSVMFRELFDGFSRSLRQYYLEQNQINTVL